MLELPPKVIAAPVEPPVLLHHPQYRCCRVPMEPTSNVPDQDFESRVPKSITRPSMKASSTTKRSLRFILSKRCLDQRIGTVDQGQSSMVAWHASDTSGKVNWRFAMADSRIKLRKLYPSLQ